MAAAAGDAAVSGGASGRAKTTVKEKVLVKEASERIEIVPPVYKAVKVRVQSEEIQEVVHAVYETVKEKALVKEASTRLEEVPAVYAEVEEKVLVKPATRKATSQPQAPKRKRERLTAGAA